MFSIEIREKFARAPKSGEAWSKFLEYTDGFFLNVIENGPIAGNKNPTNASKRNPTKNGNASLGMKMGSL